MGVLLKASEVSSAGHTRLSMDVAFEVEPLSSATGADCGPQGEKTMIFAMKNHRNVGVIVLCTLFALLASGCASMPEPQGFLSDYSRLEKTGATRMSYLSPDVREYNAIVIEPVQYRFNSDKKVITRKQETEIAKYFRTAFQRVLREKDFRIVDDNGEGVARLRAAITGIQKSRWYLNLHPVSKLAGFGVGGASMEAELIDSLTGDQLGGVMAAAMGSQFEFDHFKPLDDVEDVIDAWARWLGSRIDELRAEARQ